MWKIQKIISKGDYNYALVPDHPFATKNGYILEHRVVIENHLVRILSPYEEVHHRNGNKKDNRLQNLEVLLISEHRRKHALEQGSKMIVLKCPCCGKIFERRKNQTFLQKGGKYSTCSAKRRGVFSRKVQLGGITPEVERAISENIVSEYVLYKHDNSEQTVDIGMRRGHTPSI